MQNSIIKVALLSVCLCIMRERRHYVCMCGLMEDCHSYLNGIGLVCAPMLFRVRMEAPQTPY